MAAQIPLKPEFNRYLDAIQPTRAQRNLAKEELGFLEGKLREFIQDDDPYTFAKALRSGSFAKATALRRTEAADFDADIAVYVNVDDEAAADVADLVAYIEKLARRAYKQRTKRRPRFEINESCVRAVFTVTPKINLDIVPMVALEHETIENWGLLPKRDGTQCLTFGQRAHRVRQVAQRPAGLGSVPQARAPLQGVAERSVRRQGPEEGGELLS